MIQGDPQLKVISLIPSAGSLLLCQGAYSQVLVSAMDIFRGCYSAHHSMDGMSHVLVEMSPLCKCILKSRISHCMKILLSEKIKI
jgi:hypothetical protein